MFKYLFIFILFASCTKEPITYKIGGKKDCQILSKFGKYKSFKYSIYNWNYSDTLILASYKSDSLKVVFPEQTRINKIEYSYVDIQFCNCMVYNTVNKFLDSNLQHRIYIKNDTLIDYVILVKDTLGIKHYKKF